MEEIYAEKVKKQHEKRECAGIIKTSVYKLCRVMQFSGNGIRRKKKKSK